MFQPAPISRKWWKPGGLRRLTPVPAARSTVVKSGTDGTPTSKLSCASATVVARERVVGRGWQVVRKARKDSTNTNIRRILSEQISNNDVRRLDDEKTVLSLDITTRGKCGLPRTLLKTFVVLHACMRISLVLLNSISQDRLSRQVNAHARPSARSGSCCLQPCSQRMSGVGKLRYKSVASNEMLSSANPDSFGAKWVSLTVPIPAFFFTQCLSMTRLSSGQISESSCRPPPPTFGQVTWWVHQSNIRNYIDRHATLFASAVLK